MDLYEMYTILAELKHKLKALKRIWLIYAKQEGYDVKMVRKPKGRDLIPSHKSVASQTCCEITENFKQCENPKCYVDSSTQTEQDLRILLKNIDPNGLEHTWDPNNIQKDVTTAAENAVKETGFIYDNNSGAYYDPGNSCHYLPDLKLFYYHQSKCFYYYDDTNGKLTFYGRAEMANNETTEVADNKNTEKTESPKDARNVDNTTIESIDSFTNVEDTDSVVTCENVSGTASSTADKSWNPKKVRRSSSPENALTKPLMAHLDHGQTNKVVIEAGPKPFVPDPKNHIASCIRIIIKSSDVSTVNIGTLFIVTCNGGTLGREGSHEVIIPDLNVSKMHASFLYEYKKDGYDSFKIVDLGSRNGTYLDGIRLSNSLSTSQPFDLIHGSVIKVGSTILLCHIHEEVQTCEDCEPRFVFSRDIPFGYNTLSRLDRDILRRDEVKRLKKKFGLDYLPFFNVSLPEGYFDRSKQRRDMTGSSHSSEKTECSSTSQHVNKTNRGYQLLSKMGWQEGQGLGKGKTGIKAPVMPNANHDGKSGFGNLQSQRSALSQEEFRKALVLQKTRQRFNRANKISTQDSSGEICDKSS